MPRLSNKQRAENAIAVLDDLYAGPARALGAEITFSIRFPVEAKRPVKAKKKTQEELDTWVPADGGNVRFCKCTDRPWYQCKMHKAPRDTYVQVD